MNSIMKTARALVMVVVSLFIGNLTGTQVAQASGCSQCSSGVGAGSLELNGIRISFNLGSVSDGKSAGSLYVESDSMSVALAQPKKLFYSGRERYVGIVTDTNGALRQVTAPQVLADIVTVNDYKYEIQYYYPRQVGVTNEAGWHVVAGDPFVTWVVENPDASTNVHNRLRVSRVSVSGTNMNEYAWDDVAETWSLTSGNGLKKETTHEDWDEATANRVVTREIKDGSGQAVWKEVKKSHFFPFGENVVEESVDPDGDALTTTYSYYEDSSATGRFGNIKHIIRPDGFWIAYDYDSNGRKTLQLEPWKNAPTGSVASACRAWLYDYTPVDPREDGSSLKDVPRAVTEQVFGKTLSKTYHAYFQDPNGDTQRIVEQCSTPDAGYGAEGNLRTTTISFGGNAAAICAGKVKSTIYEDGRMDTYSYESGTYTTNADHSQCGFIVGIDGDTRISIVHGTTNHPDGFAYRSTKDVTIQDKFGNEVLSETYVSTGSGYERIGWTVSCFDERGRPTTVYHSDGTWEETVWGCCGIESETDSMGIKHSYLYDDRMRLDTEIKEGYSGGEYPAQADIYTTHIYDAADRELSKKISAGGLVIVTSNSYDVSGTLRRSVDAAGLITSNQYTDGGRISISTLPGGGQVIAERCLDGKTRTVFGTGVVPACYDYGVNDDGTQWMVQYMGPAATNSAKWVRYTKDMLGRPIREEKPGFGGTVLTNTFCYNMKGQKVRSATSGHPDTIYEYDEMGNLVVVGTDVNGNGMLDRDGLDSVNEPDAFYVKEDGDWWQVSLSRVYATEGNADLATNSVQKVRQTGLNSDLTQEIRSIDIFGNETVMRASVDRASKKFTQTVTYSGSTNAEVSVTVNGLLVTSTIAGLEYSYGYDALGRQTSVADPRRGNCITHYNGWGQVDWVEDAVSGRTSYTYDPATGVKISASDAFGKTVYYGYDIGGQLRRMWGDTVYPVSYNYDCYGRTTNMVTYREGSGWDGATWPEDTGVGDATTWLYDEATGLLTNKLYADNKGPSYTYTPDGKLSTRIWARGIVTIYGYDNLGQLTNISYSDSTPAVTFTYNRFGGQATITDGTGTRIFTYNDAMQLASETNTQGVLIRSYDVQGRLSGLDAGSDYSIRYGYNVQGRFLQVASTVNGQPSTVYSYSYLPGTDFPLGYTNDAGFAVMRTYEANRNLIASLTNSFRGVPLRRFDYFNDVMGRRTQRADVDISTVISNQFAYNARSELEDAVMGTNTFSYRYDPIGNFVVSTNKLLVAEYLSNPLNQYTNIAGMGGPSYDDDGNMTFCAGWTFAWDAENRLVFASNANMVVRNAYDYMSRRVMKSTSISTNVFIYDDWNLITEKTMADGVLSTNFYTWGVDLSGSSQGAGGVGGLLGIQASGSCLLSPICDANGNITELVDTNGNIVAHYEYDPYGNAIVISGSEGSNNLFRFSSKYWDDEIGLYYYGYRFYNPVLGRWITRDPMQEGVQTQGNVCEFSGNNSVCSIDVLGLWNADVHNTMTRDWAVAMQYNAAGASAIGEYDEGVDGGLTSPIWGDQSYHFDRPPSSNSRRSHYDAHLNAAKGKCTWHGAHMDKDIGWHSAAWNVGYALHPIQDWVAHGDYGARNPTRITVVHNHYDPTSQGHDNFPDDPTRDAGGGDGRPDLSVMQYVWVRFHTVQADWAVYRVVGQASARIRLTRQLTEGGLREFLDHVRQSARPCFKCRKTFLRPDNPFYKC